MAVWTFNLSDVGLGHLAGLNPVVEFHLNGPAMDGMGGVYATHPATTTPSPSGACSVELMDTSAMIGDAWLEMHVKWNEPGTKTVDGYSPVDFHVKTPLRTDGAGGPLAGAIGGVSNLSMVYVSLTAPKISLPGMFWLQQNPDNLADPLNTAQLFRFSLAAGSWQWKPIANLRGAPGVPGDAVAMDRFDSIDYLLAFHNDELSRLLDARRDVLNAQGYAHAFTDKDGSLAAGIKTNATFNFEKPISVMGETGVAGQPIYAPGFSRVFADKDGYSPMAIRDDGTVEIYKGGAAGPSSLKIANDALGYTRSSKKRIGCIGDSLTQGFDNTAGAWPATDSWPGVLQTLLPSGVSVFNRAVAGWAIDEVGIRVGALPLNVTVTGGNIPASGPVTVTTTQAFGWVPAAARSFPGTLAGVPGTLDRSTTGTFTFTRATTGTAVPVAGAMKFAPDWDVHQLDSIIVYLGRNDVSLGIIGADGNIIDHVVNTTVKIVNHLTVDLKQALVVGTITRSTELAGSGNHTTVVAINNRLKEIYGSRFLDISQYLATAAIYDQGITPTPEDLTAMAGDTMPPSIVAPGDGGTHYNKATASLLASKQFAPYLTTREWV